MVFRHDLHTVLQRTKKSANPVGNVLSPRCCCCCDWACLSNARIMRESTPSEGEDVSSYGGFQAMQSTSHTKTQQQERKAKLSQQIACNKRTVPPPDAIASACIDAPLNARVEIRAE